jgi:hypothetical protein
MSDEQLEPVTELAAEPVAQSRFYYAQLDAENKVICKSDLSGEVIAPGMIAVTSLDNFQLGDLYENGQFVTPEPVPELQP